MAENINWNKVRLVIFDVDGTLYDQKKLRRKMTGALLRHYLPRPWCIHDLQVIRVFRKEREKMSADPVEDLENAQYVRCASMVGRPPEQVKAIITRWMHSAPLPFLREYLYSGARELMEALRDQGIKTAIYSDYPATDKLKAMGLAADLVVSSTDTEIDALKPNPAGLYHIAKTLDVPVRHCLFIGDRDEMDGACARNAGMAYNILPQQDKDKAWSELLHSFRRNYGQ